MDVQRRRVRCVAAIAAASVLTLGAAACSTSSNVRGSDGSGGGKVAIVGFSVLKPGYDAVAKAFLATPGGKGVRVSQSFGASGSQSKAVASGQPADYVGLLAGARHDFAGARSSWTRSGTRGRRKASGRPRSSRSWSGRATRCTSTAGTT